MDGWGSVNGGGSRIGEKLLIRGWSGREAVAWRDLPWPAESSGNTVIAEREQSCF